MHLTIIPDNVKHLTRKTWSTWKNYQSLDCTAKLKSHNGPRKQLMLGGQKTQGRPGTTTLLKVSLCAEEVSNRSNELNKGAIGRVKMKNGKTKKEKPCTGYKEEGRMVQAVAKTQRHSGIDVLQVERFLLFSIGTLQVLHGNVKNVKKIICN